MSREDNKLSRIALEQKKEVLVDNPRAANPRACEECGELLRVHPKERTKEGWIWCRKCGLVSNWDVVGRMSIVELVRWVEVSGIRCRYSEMRKLVEDAEEIGVREALARFLDKIRNRD